LLICSDLTGDRPRPLPTIKEFKGAVDITERKDDPSWDFDVSSLVYLYAFLRFIDSASFSFAYYISSLFSRLYIWTVRYDFHNY